MKVEIISETVQRFNGVSYYKCGLYFQRKGVRLHRAVWEYHNGSIPKGYHIHHLDENRANNDIENLALLSQTEHLASHMNLPKRVEQSKRLIKIASKKAAEWHGGEEGKLWHSEHIKKYWENAPEHTFTCDWCGKEYQSRCVNRGGNHFCCANHKAAALRWRRKHEGQENYPGRKS